MAVLTEAGVTKSTARRSSTASPRWSRWRNSPSSVRRLTGTFTSKRLIYAPPTGKLLDDVREAYGAHVYPDGK